MREEDVDDIIKAYKSRATISRYAREVSLKEIKENAFLGCGKKMMFCAPEGSEIEKYVEENSIKFKAI